MPTKNLAISLVLITFGNSSKKFHSPGDVCGLGTRLNLGVSKLSEFICCTSCIPLHFFITAVTRNTIVLEEKIYYFIYHICHLEYCSHISAKAKSIISLSTVNYFCLILQFQALAAKSAFAVLYSPVA